MFSKKIIQKLFKKILITKFCEDLIIKEYPNDQMKTPMHMSKGEEIIISSIVSIFGENNDYFGYYRSHSLYLSVTENIKGFLGELYGKKIGQNEGLTGSMHIFTPESNIKLMSAIVSGTIAPSLGNAYGNLINKKKKYTICFFGDGATEEGVFWETLNFAKKKKIPVLFVCLNNGLAVDLKIKERQSYSLSDVGNCFKLKCFNIDSSNVKEVLKKSKSIKDYLQKFKEPVLVNANYFRFLQHLGIDRDPRLTKKEYEKNLKKYESYNLVKNFVLKKKYINKKIVIKLEKLVSKRIEIIMKLINKSKFSNSLKKYKAFYE